MTFSPARILYHVTPVGNVDAILRDGLLPRVGERSAKVGEIPGTYLFHDLVDLEDAVTGWLGDEFDPYDTLSVLQVTLPTDFPDLRDDVGYERFTTHPIPASCLSLLLEDVDDLSFDTSDRRLATIEATEANVEAARSFVMERWVAWQEEKFPGRPAPTDLSGACKFASAFAHRLFGGDLVANERHQFVVLEGGDVLDLNRDAADVAAMEAPYQNDLSMPDEPEWRDAMESIRPRVDAWVEDFRRLAAPTMVPA